MVPEIILALFLTLVIEIFVYLILGYRELDFFGVVIFINIATNLSLNLFLNFLIFRISYFTQWTYIPIIILLEVGIYFIELIPLRQMTINQKRIKYTVLFANLSSFLIGSLLVLILSRLL